eukprot:g4578.t1
MKALVLFLSLCGVTTADDVGGAALLTKLIKYTMTADDPHSALAFMQAHFPVEACDAPGLAQPGALCNGTFTCGSVGRSQLKQSSVSTYGASAGLPGANIPFSIHMVNATCRPVNERSLTPAAAEVQFDAKFTAAVVAGGGYDHFMDYALVVLAADLGSWLAQWQQAGVQFFPLSWKDDAGEQWWSAVVQVPHTQYVFEVVCATKPDDSALAAPVAWRADALARLPSALLKGKKAGPGVWLPLAVSKASSDLDALMGFYAAVLGATTSAPAASADGSARVSFASWPRGNMQVRVIERNGSTCSNTTGPLTVRAFEQAKFASHNMTLGRTFEESALCAQDKWVDNHWGVAFLGGPFGGGPTFSYILGYLRDHNWPYTMMWNSKNHNASTSADTGAAPPLVQPGYVLAVGDPSGDYVEVNAMGANAAAPPAWAKPAEGDALCGPVQSQALCADGGLCSQGQCGTYSPAPPAACTAALAAACPAGALASCSNCVYAPATFAALRAKGCYAADLYKFCVPSNFTIAAM